MELTYNDSNLKYIKFPNGQTPYLRFSPKNGVNRLVFKSQDLWFIDIPYPFRNWIHISEDQGQVGSHIISIETIDYSGDSLREGYILLNCWDDSIKIPLIQYPEYIPCDDEKFMEYLIENFDKDRDGKISYNEAYSINSCTIDCTSIKSITGIKYLFNLTYLNLYCLDQQTCLDLSHNIALKTLCCSDNHITNIILNNCTVLETLYCDLNLISSLDLSHCKALSKFSCSGNNLSSLDLSYCESLTLFNCCRNNLESLDLSKCKALRLLLCRHNKLTSLNVHNCSDLSVIRCADNLLTNLDLSDCEELKLVMCANNKLTNLNLDNCGKLKSLNVASNQLAYVDLKQCFSLRSLTCIDNKLTSLDLSCCSLLERLRCSENQLDNLDLSKCINLKKTEEYDIYKKENII